MTHTTPPRAPDVPRLIAIDWGTTSQRAWLLGDDGAVIAARRQDNGLLATTQTVDLSDEMARARAYERVFLDVCGDWLSQFPDLPSIACGMVGSAQGWLAAPYLTVPAPLDLAAHLKAVRHHHGLLYIVPGLRMAPAPDGLEAGDVLRGEETQLLGVLADLDESADAPEAAERSLVVVLPGTHTKWVHVRGAEVCTFVTALTGELFDMLTRHGLLARTAATPVRDDAAFEHGVRTASESARGLAAELFGGRALVLDQVLAPSSLPDYLSGVLVADEVAHLRHTIPADASVVLCGTADLVRRYRLALAEHDISTTTTGELASARGLWMLALDAGLLSAPVRSPLEEKS